MLAASPWSLVSTNHSPDTPHELTNCPVRFMTIIAIHVLLRVLVHACRLADDGLGGEVLPGQQASFELFILCLDERLSIKEMLALQ